MRDAKPLLLTLGLGVFAGALDLGVLSPALPAIGRQFSVPTGDLAWIFTLYLLVNVASIAIASTLADRLGRRPVYQGCIALFALGSILAITAPRYGIFLFARARFGAYKPLKQNRNSGFITTDRAELGLIITTVRAA